MFDEMPNILGALGLNWLFAHRPSLPVETGARIPGFCARHAKGCSIQSKRGYEPSSSDSNTAERSGGLLALARQLTTPPTHRFVRDRQEPNC
jgi:hypothetical protein